MLQPQAASDDTGATPAATEAKASVVDLRIEAPAALIPLLQRHLDVARLNTVSAGEQLSELEWRRIQASTPSQVRSLLETEGYFDAKVKVERREAQPAQLRVEVDPGPRATVQRIVFDVQGELERLASGGDAEAKTLLETLRSDWPLPEGSVFRNARWADAKTSVLARLRAEGYTAASWSGTAAQVDAATHAVRLTLILDTGALYHLGDLRIEGLEQQDSLTVRHLAGFAKGAPATEAALLDFQDRLVRTGLYDQASVLLDTDNADPAGTPVLVRLKEAPLQLATVGVGISANTGPRVSLEHTHRRIFGQRATARNKLELGRLRQAWEGELSSHAQPDLYRNLLGGTFERLVAKDDGDVVRSLRGRIGRVQETTRRERYTFIEVERADRRTDTSNQSIDAASLNFHGVWRKVDNVLLPTEGLSVSVQTGLGYARSRDANNTESGSDSGPYGRVVGRVSAWLPLGGNFFGEARFEAGQVFVKDSVAVPDTQLFRAGGDDSVRGYAYRSLGPIVDGSVAGGRVMSTASIEIARPVSDKLPTVWWALFADAGQAAQRWTELDPVWGAGVGVRWRSPVGPLRVDWAWGNATRRGRLHLSVGVVF